MTQHIDNEEKTVSERRLKTQVAQTEARLQRLRATQHRREEEREEKTRTQVNAKKKKLDQDIENLRARFLRSLTNDQRKWFDAEEADNRKRAERRRVDELSRARSDGHSEGYRAAMDKAYPNRYSISD